MEDSRIELLEQRIVWLAKLAILFQCVASAVAISLLYFQPNGFSDIGQIFSATALISSAVISKTYIYTGKKLEAFKTFSPNEIAARKQEYFRKFFFPYGLWPLFYGIFSRV